MLVLAQAGRVTSDPNLPISSDRLPGVVESLRLEVWDSHGLLVSLCAALVVLGLAIVLHCVQRLVSCARDEGPARDPSRTLRVLVDGLLGWRAAFFGACLCALVALLAIVPVSEQQDMVLLTALLLSALFACGAMVIGASRLVRTGRVDDDACPRCGYEIGAGDRCSECGAVFAEVGVVSAGQYRSPMVWRWSGRVLTPMVVGVLCALMVTIAVPLPVTLVGERSDATRASSGLSTMQHVQAWIVTRWTADLVVSTSPVDTPGGIRTTWRRAMRGSVFARDYTDGSGFTTIEPALFDLVRRTDSSPMLISPTGREAWTEIDRALLRHFLGPACEIGSQTLRDEISNDFALTITNAFGDGPIVGTPRGGGWSVRMRVEHSLWSWLVPTLAGLGGWLLAWRCLRGVGRSAVRGSRG